MLRKSSAIALLVISSAAFAGPVNINSADAKTLAAELQGIGPGKAQAIVKFREAHGRFKTTEDIKKVRGIGPSIYEANKPNIKIKD